MHIHREIRIQIRLTLIAQKGLVAGGGDEVTGGRLHEWMICPRGVWGHQFAVSFSPLFALCLHLNFLREK